MGRLHRMLMMSARKDKPTPPDQPLYEHILVQMDKDMPGLRDSLVCWYDPRLQGLTNEQLADNYPTYVDGLRDLSGNERHMTLYGMKGTSGNGMIDSDGKLVFDGIDDWGMYEYSDPIRVEKFDFFLSRELDPAIVKSGSVSLVITDQTKYSSTPEVIIDQNSGGLGFRYFSSVLVPYSKIEYNGIVYTHDNKIYVNNLENITPPQVTIMFVKYILLNRLRTTGIIGWIKKFRTLIVTNRKLTRTEADYILTNLINI